MNAIVGTVYTLSEEKCVPVEEFNNYLYSLFMFLQLAVVEQLNLLISLSGK